MKYVNTLNKIDEAAGKMLVKEERSEINNCIIYYVPSIHNIHQDKMQ